MYDKLTKSDIKKMQDEIDERTLVIRKQVPVGWTLLSVV